MLQGVEYYKQRYICYSLGNFCFGGNTNPMDYRTVIYQQTFPIKNGQLVPGEAMRTQVRVVPLPGEQLDERERLPAHADFRRPGGLGDQRRSDGYSATLAG